MPPPKAVVEDDGGTFQKKKKKVGIPKNKLKKDAGKVFADIAATTEEKHAGTALTLTLIRTRSVTLIPDLP